MPTISLDKQANTTDRLRANAQKLGSPTFNEVPSGAINGSNVTFLLSSVPLLGTLQLFLNGLLMNPSTDFSVSSAVVTLTVAPSGGDILLAHFWS